MNMRRTWILVGMAGTALGCAPAQGDGEALSSQAQPDTAPYVSLVDYDDSAYQFVWPDIQAKLNQEFDAVCGDTFCEGDFSNLTALRASCSVASADGTVEDCVWSFAGSLEAVDPHTAAITVDAPTFQCHFHPVGTTAADFVSLLSGSTDAIHETLPGTSGSIYDALVDCFQHPIGATPITFDTTPPLTYVEVADYYVSPTWKAKWANAKAALVNGFDDVCGDTFCESDYSDLQSMAFVCSITKSTGNVKGCSWVFAGSYSMVQSSGVDEATTSSFNCHIGMHGTLAQLITTLTASGTTDPIHRPLPGTTQSAYDQLVGCLP